EDAIGAGTRRALRQLDRVLCRRRSGAGDHRHAIIGDLKRKADQETLLADCQSRRLASGAVDDEPGYALPDLPLAELSERVMIDAFAAEWRRQRAHISRKSGDTTLGNGRHETSFQAACA